MKRISIAALVAIGALVTACATTRLPRTTEVEPAPQVQPTIPEPAPMPRHVQLGKASFYADSFHGKRTASGEPMDQNALTAASRVLPLGAQAKVTNLATGRSVIVVVNDRGPYAPGRIVDLSKRAAAELDMRDNGIVSVRVEADPRDQPTAALRAKVAKIAAAQERAKRLADAREAARNEPKPAQRIAAPDVVAHND